MKKLKKMVVLALSLTLCLCLCGCEKFLFVNILGYSEEFVEYYKNPEGYVVFSTDDEEIYIPTEELSAYTTAYPDCNGEMFKNLLSGEDLLVYNGYLFAMENCYTRFMLYVEDNSKDFGFIREAVSLDSPFLEQNVNVDGETTTRWEDNKKIAFTVEQFESDRWELKMEALEVLREVVSKIPAETDTVLSKMQYLYHYVCDNIEYTSYEKFYGNDFLYDAVCKGKTNCDGYSNMYSLLLNLIGVECCEAMGDDIEDESLLSEEELSEEEGHTWVVAKVDGNYYNFDPTFEDTMEEFLEERLVYFAFSDELVDIKYFDSEESRPKCTDTSLDFDYVGLTVENITDWSQIKKIANFTDSQTAKRRYTNFVLVKSLVDEATHDAFLNRYIEMVYNISHVSTLSVDFNNCSVIRFVTEPW